MRQINCYIPIKLRITGRLSDAQLEQLGEAIARTVAARIAFAESTILHGKAVAEEWVIEQAQERIDTSRLVAANYEVPAYDRHGERRRLPVRSPSVAADSSDTTEEQQPSLPLLTDFHDYAFFFTGGAYGRAAEAFIREFYPDHHRFQARSFEQMFHLLLQDIRSRTRRSGRRVYISEIVIVTHANAAGGA